MRKSLFLILFLSACSVDKCNDYTIAYYCTEKYGTECREHYLDMIEECLNARRCNKEENAA